MKKPIAAPSANKSGKLTCTNPRDVFAKLKNSIDALLNGGDAELGLESTVVDCSVEKPCILRLGNITLDEISSCLEYKIVTDLQNRKTDKKSRTIVKALFTRC